MQYGHCVAYSFAKTCNGDREIVDGTISPGPGKYYPSNYTLKNPPGFKMGKDARGTDRNLKTPGVGEYAIPTSVPAGAQYSMKGPNKGEEMNKQHCSPGPARYQPSYHDGSAKYSMAPRPKTAVSKHPGVGNYNITSDKSLQAPSYIFGHEKKGNSTNMNNNPPNMKKNRTNINNPNNARPQWNEEDPGPGDYAPNPNFVKQSNPTFSFGHEPRPDQAIPQTNTQTPGVGNYNQKTFFGTEGAHACMVPPTSAPRIKNDKDKETPGPGEYNMSLYNKPNCAKFKMGTTPRPCSASGLRSKTGRSLNGNSNNNKITPGPCDYNPDKSLNTLLSHAPKWGMGENDPNAIDPNIMNHPISPGPGKYNTSENMGKGPKYSLAPRNEPKNTWLKSTPGPGEYNSETLVALNKNPTWKMGSEPRADQMKNVRRDDYPSPAEYIVKKVVLGPGYTFTKETKSKKIKGIEAGPGFYKIPCSIVDVNGYTRYSGKFERQYKYV